MKVIKKIALILILLIVVIPNFSKASLTNGKEEIQDYTSDIYINEDSTVVVEEKITVYAAGKNIKRGIYRDFPTKYKDKYGNNYNVKFEVLEVLKDGVPEKYTQEKKSNGVRVKIGDPNKLLKTGTYTYTIKYKTNRQLGYFDDHDEIYWNVTGNGWDFDINKATAIVHLPEKADMSQVKFEAYTGSQGSTDKYYTADKMNSDKIVIFTTTKNLYSGQGLTIVVGFEKGLVHEPTFQEKLGWFLDDNKGFLIGLIGVVIVIIYGAFTWTKIGKDPKKDIIIPRYNPPEGLSPAEVKYIDSMGKYDKVFEASILNLAVHGYIKIETEEKKVIGFKSQKYTLIKTNKEIGNDISEDEAMIYKRLPEEAKLEYSSSLQSKLASMQTEQKNNLNKAMNKKMYSKNSGYVAIAIVISLIFCIIGALLYGGESAFTAFFSIAWALPWCAGTVLLVKDKKRKGMGILFTVILVAVSFGFAKFMGSAMFILIAIFVMVNVIYAFLIKAYTEEGRKIKDEIEGFKLFIKTASEDEIKQQTPETFDKFFPYAYVLGLENEWSEKFEKLLEEFNYQPTWCTGMAYTNGFRATSFTNSFSSSFKSSISSASVAPGSSSGFSGGGGRRRWILWRRRRRPEAAEAGKPKLKDGEISPSFLFM